jgi:hypothetical protein
LKPELLSPSSFSARFGGQKETKSSCALCLTRLKAGSEVDEEL